MNRRIRRDAQVIRCDEDQQPRMRQRAQIQSTTSDELVAENAPIWNIQLV